jgi:hypothetical protein
MIAERIAPVPPSNAGVQTNAAAFAGSGGAGLTN